jgi:dipeptidase E
MTLRLVLYSDFDHPGNLAIHERLLELIGKARPRVGYVSSSPDPERIYFDGTRAHYAELGASLACYTDELDDRADSFAALLDCDAIHLSGGNTFSFLAWLRRTGRLPALQTYARERGVLAGVSAGAILMTPDVRSAAWCGDANVPSVNDFRGLGLVPFSFLPHAGSRGVSMPTAGDLALVPSPLYACPDGSGLVVEGDSIQICGAPLVA